MFVFNSNNSYIFSGCRNEQVTSVEKPHVKNDAVFKGTNVNRTLSSLHGRSLEIKLTVPLEFPFKCKLNEETKKEPNVKCCMNY